MLTGNSDHGDLRQATAFMRAQHPYSPTRTLWTATVLATASLVAGCVDPASLALGGASAVSLAQSGKTLTDHAMSMATDQDCSLMHSLEGEPWCVPASGIDPSAPPQPLVYCYRSIAEVNCYRQLNRHDTRTRRMKSPATDAMPAPTESADAATK